MFVAVDGKIAGLIGVADPIKESTPEAIETLHAAVRAGTQLIYLSVRPSQLRALTERQMADAGVPAGKVVFDCPNSPWRLGEAQDSGMPFRTVKTLEIRTSGPSTR